MQRSTTSPHLVQASPVPFSGLVLAGFSLALGLAYAYACLAG